MFERCCSNLSLWRDPVDEKKVEGMSIYEEIVSSVTMYLLYTPCCCNEPEVLVVL